MDIAFVCVQWGTKYDAEDVARLYRGIRRHSRLSAPFYCLTDRTAAFAAHPMVRPIVTTVDWHGWWQKIHLFRRGTIPHRHLVLFDLDMVILGSLDPILDLIGQYDLVHAMDPIDTISSSLLIIDTDSTLAADITAEFEPEKWVKPEDIDQDYLRLFVARDRYRIHCLPPALHYSYKCLVDHENWRARATNPQYGAAALPEIATLNFHGLPKPADLSRAPDAWPLAPDILKNWG